MTEGRYDIEEKAAKYDDDPNDKDSKQETVIEIVARTRGVNRIFSLKTINPTSLQNIFLHCILLLTYFFQMFWILFPGTIFMAN